MKKRTYITKIISVLTLSALFLSVFGCDGGKVTAEDLMRDIVPSQRGSKSPESKSAETIDFAVRLMQESMEDGKNTLISPLSVITALAMAVNGAEGNTLSELETSIGMTRDELNGFLAEYVNSLPAGETYKLHTANSIWFTNDSRFTVKKDFLQKNADTFKADVYKAPFDNSTLKDINNWIENETDGMIKDILDNIPGSAVIYLVNALAFEAEWRDIYLKHQVDDGEFHLSDGSIQKVEFMNGAENKYLSDGNAEGFIKYYSGGKYAFAALLPDENTSVYDYVNTLDGEKLLKTLSEAQNRTVHTSIPKFEVEYNTEMSGVLGNMGVKDAFNFNTADFSGLGSSTGGNIFISRVLHKTYISVGEKGTRAGAATIVEMNDGAAPETEGEIKYVYLDRPFLYMIIDCETNIPVFVGVLNSIK